MRDAASRTEREPSGAHAERSRTVARALALRSRTAGGRRRRRSEQLPVSAARRILRRGRFKILLLPIGVRKALGATRGDILVQFLIEAATLTGIGGVIGILVGIGVGQAVTRLLGIDAAPPVGLTLIAVFVSVGIGVVFGVLPARRAARLDPIEALRYE